ncbi:3-dehydroquinate synthase [Hazenella sp. IB182357]|uniref:3-dehydroquinate synthase n=1 Tax=Polycladospora coralii TaxID=2771432 RepID=A0A926N8B3_9BACL|nr:3-dehydroquinate synthase [Polycladospora coralii]MBD1371617.1 3-dehydroquinate synthase [Polycladospora coralii]MBS7529084.1 3-dehydroquinate synthase [Polycladospora coralii]
MIVHDLSVKTKNHSYDIQIGSGLHKQLVQSLRELGITQQQKLMLISDSHVGPLYAGRIQDQLCTAGYEVGTCFVPAGEASKSILQYERVVGACLKFGLDRKSVILALGGGVVGDLAGFVAASFMRGIPFIQLPTTLLAHDSAVGGKVGINHAMGKNLIGAFHQPLRVIFDVDTLSTLPLRQLRSGFAELIKEALIWDVSFVGWLENHQNALLGRDPSLLCEAIYRGCRIKATIVEQDEKENGIRAILNYGHTIGHAIEACAGYKHYTHGECVAIGMVSAVYLGQWVLKTPPAVIDKTIRLIESFGLPTQFSLPCSDDELINLIKHDKKSTSGRLSFILPKQLGHVEMVEHVQEALIVQALQVIRGG